MTEDNQNATPPADPATEGQPEEPANLSLWQLIGSAIAAAVGVQSSANRKRDFSRGKAGQFIVIGVIGTALFVLAMYLLVRLVLSQVPA
ncbi:MAG: DUF2970 domain-containing protein [Pseudomonadota bacterium]